MCFPSGENVIQVKNDVYFPNGFNAASPVLTFQTWIISSCVLEAMYFPSGENEMELTAPVWPSISFNAYSPVLAFQSRVVPSYEPEAMCCPSGENETDVTDCVISNWFQCRFASFDVPESDCTIV